jgi:hypothetical protein
MTLTRCTFLSLVLAASGLRAQEIKYIEFSATEQRTELRHPPCGSAINGITCVAGGFRGASVRYRPKDPRHPQTLGVYLLRVVPTDITAYQPFEAEFKIVNTGRTSVRLPVSPNLSDLQPNDESADFSYLKLLLETQLNPVASGQDLHGVGTVYLYGSIKHKGSTVKLRPGKWIRVRAKMKLHNWPTVSFSANLRAQFLLQSIVFRAKPGGWFDEIENLDLDRTNGPAIPVHFSPAPG